jgi:hypothetical protein
MDPEGDLPQGFFASQTVKRICAAQSLIRVPLRELRHDYARVVTLQETENDEPRGWLAGFGVEKEIARP